MIGCSLAGGAADKNGTLKVGDEILSVNSVDVTRMTRLEAWNFMKKLNDGNQVVTVRQKLVNVPLVKTELVARGGGGVESGSTSTPSSRVEKTH